MRIAFGGTDTDGAALKAGGVGTRFRLPRGVSLATQRVTSSICS